MESWHLTTSQLRKFQISIDVDFKGAGLQETVLEHCTHEKDQESILNLVLLDRAVDVLHNSWHVLESSEWGEDGVADDYKDEESDTQVTDHGRKDCVDAAYFIVLAGDLQLRHGIDIAAVHVVVCSLLRKLVANVLLDLNERTFVRSSDAILDMHPDNIILILNI